MDSSWSCVVDPRALHHSIDQAQRNRGGGQGLHDRGVAHVTDARPCPPTALPEPAHVRRRTVPHAPYELSYVSACCHSTEIEVVSLADITSPTHIAVGRAQRAADVLGFG